MPINRVHLAWVLACFHMLEDHFRGRADVFVGSEMLVIYEEANTRVAAVPDLFVSFGVAPGSEASYRVSREGKPPDVVWEFASPSTARVDATEKKEKYRQMGVQEYWLVDPVGGYHSPRLQGFELSDSTYTQMPWELGPDGMVSVWSPRLHLEQRLVDGLLRFWNRAAGQYLERKEMEAERRRQVAESRLESEAQARRQADSRAESEAQARRQADSRAESEAQARRQADSRAESEAQARRQADSRAESEAQARRQADSRAESEAQARRQADSRTESAKEALEAEKRVTRDLRARLANFEAESRNSRSRE